MRERVKILAVDDEEYNLEIIDYNLARAGYEVVPAEDGIAALQRLEENADIDLIVLDRMMPNLDGMEFLQRIKATHAFRIFRSSCKQRRPPPIKSCRASRRACNTT